MHRYIAFALFLFIPAAVLAQESSDPWQPLRFLEGTWTGDGEGPSGQSQITQHYDFILEGNYLKTTTRAEFPPSDKNPNGEVHEDLAIISYDRARGTHVMRGFYVEGFVNTFTLDTITDHSLVFNTIDSENAPPGTKARLVWEKVSDTEMTESFWVAFPGKELACFVTNRLIKQK